MSKRFEEVAARLGIQEGLVEYQFDLLMSEKLIRQTTVGFVMMGGTSLFLGGKTFSISKNAAS